MPMWANRIVGVGHGTGLEVLTQRQIAKHNGTTIAHVVTLQILESGTSIREGSAELSRHRSAHRHILTLSKGPACLPDTD